MWWWQYIRVVDGGASRMSMGVELPWSPCWWWCIRVVDGSGMLWR